ncbi:MAG: filamentous hemagglutinin N-terminal domain-containing protein, partial [Bradyrhizobium sp.]|uniref:two-partner secretion domain-containing protein n=1 Tax=Bradyrhizobium sp. TaxID=376 RepID=UPI001DAC6C54
MTGFRLARHCDGDHDAQRRDAVMMGDVAIEVRPRHGRSRRALLAGTSAVALLLLAPQIAAARPLGTTAQGASPITSAVAAQQAAAAQAAAAAAQAQTSLSRAAAALQAMRNAQSNARALAVQSPGMVPDGLGTGALMPDPNIANDPTLWQNATLPTQQIANGRAVVDVTQLQPKAILNWQTFNVGRNTTLNFNQGGSDWTVLNRVDPTMGPSTILGQVNAKGGVYVINRNGIIFGAGAQINVHALVASTLDVGAIGSDRATRDEFFLDQGIAAPKSFSIFDPVAGANTLLTGGDVRVEAGASITTDIVSLDSPGFVYLFANHVTNAGSITVPAGEAAMVAGRSIELVPNGFFQYPSNVVPNGTSFRGTEFRIQPFAMVIGNHLDFSSFPKGTGTIADSGLIETPRGIVMLTGAQVTTTSDSVISADTSISRNAMVIMRAVGSISMNGAISMLPFDDGNTLPIGTGGSSSSVVQSFTPAYVELSAQSEVALGSSALISAPAGSVNVRAVQLGRLGVTTLSLGVYAADSNGQPINGTMSFDGPDISAAVSLASQRVLLQPGATIDVAGLQDVVLPVSANYVSYQPRAEFADMPLQRNGPLYGQTMWIDIRATGTRSDGTTWVGTPLFDASGVIGSVGRTIYQLMTSGGTVNLTTETRPNGLVQDPGRDVVLQPGSIINFAGGYVHYTGG